MRTIRTTMIGAALAALLLPAAAGAHVTVAPETAGAGERTELTIRVPNESPTENVVELAVQFTPGVDDVRPGAIPGWEIDVEEAGGEVRTVTWTGNGNSGKIAPTATGEFPIEVGVPGDAELLTLKAVERYDGGKVSRWIGAPDADNPAPVVRVSGVAAAAPQEPAPAGEPTATTGVPTPEPSGGTQAPAESPSAGAAPASEDADEDEDEDDDGGVGTIVIAVVIALLVGAGIAAVLARRRRTT